MPVYTFAAYITIEGIDEEDAIYNYDQIRDLNGVLDTYCYEIKEDTKEIN